MRPLTGRAGPAIVVVVQSGNSTTVGGSHASISPRERREQHCPPLAALAVGERRPVGRRGHGTSVSADTGPQRAQDGGLAGPRPGTAGTAPATPTSGWPFDTYDQALPIALTP